MTGTLHLIRHGQTTANVEKILDTRPPGAALTAEGRDQARRFAADRPGVRPAALLSSVARRAQQTADLIGKGWGVPYRVVDGVHEIQVGDLEGRNDEAALERFREFVRRWHDGDGAARSEGGESVDDLLERYIAAVDRIREDDLPGGDVYLVSHGAAIRLAAARLAGVPADFAFDNHLANASEVVLAPEGDRWRLVSWGETTRSDADPMG
ncbi:histidine phosphatase family protein [Tsukamurella sp. 8F]|uniref:histidine phosphatase family protein n=1 Tax=unclassified Tsukamurella TaxID=2633480 RepID=UPI0023B8B9F0|nr:MULTISPECIES: histidine phosphatase family protein [unclassified Tsukamurella]MDF0530813.1 histidine phosphatase family protein [Tsukamurella sp. 8J]MDF0588339.1 histidine phosphatase family protein [Tsukamurella sp. 8F]